MTRGKFITFEGGEGTGKSTQAERLADRLRTLAIEVVATREPGGTPLGEAIRRLLFEETPERSTEFLLFAAARAEHVAKVIQPALARGAWVVCDRFIDSTRVYQGQLAGVPADLISTVERAVVGTAMPNLTLILDLDPEEGRRRLSARGELSRFDAANESTHRRLRDGFRGIAEAEPNRCRLIDAGRSADDVARDIWTGVERQLLAGAR
jgi:dTMP kinase